MTGADIIIESLKRADTQVVFAYPGATSLPLHQALLDSDIRVVLPRHEQGGAFAAEGYARATGRLGVCLATSGPGATNLVTGITDAYMDSVPLLAITAQVPNRFIGKNAFQETDIIGLTRPVVKHSFLVLNLEELPEVMKDAVTLATTGRPGPVVVDVACNFLNAELPEFDFPQQPSLRAIPDLPEIPAASFRTLRKWLRESQRPCLYVGGGVISANASGILRRIAEQNFLPVVTSLMGIGAMPTNHPNLLGGIGTILGNSVANQAVKECDLLLAIGVRFSDRTTGDPHTFAPKARIIQLEIDPSEINKNRQVDLALIGDLKELLPRLAKKTLPASTERSTWLRDLQNRRKKLQAEARTKSNGSKITAEAVCTLLKEYTDPAKTILLTGVGEHQICAAKNYPFQAPRSLLTSGGLGAMGFGLPAAIGAAIGAPEKQIILIDGDGSFQMNIQEMATLYAEGLNVKILILNNQKLGMVWNWEERLHKRHHAHTDLAVAQAGRPYPDFATIAKGYMIPAIEASTMAQLRKALPQILQVPGAALLDIHTI